MTNLIFSVIVKQERKADRSVQRKEGTQMNTTMILSYFKYERYEHALDRKTGLGFCARIFKRAKSYVPGKAGMYRELC